MSDSTSLHPKALDPNPSSDNSHLPSDSGTDKSTENSSSAKIGNLKTAGSAFPYQVITGKRNRYKTT